jgi:hypothetical protein
MPEPLEFFGMIGVDIWLEGKTYAAALHTGNAESMEILLKHAAVGCETDILASVVIEAVLQDPDIPEDVPYVEEAVALWRVQAAAIPVAARLLEQWDADLQSPLSRTGLTREHAAHVTMVSVLFSQNRLGEIFDPARWRGRLEEAVTLHAEIKEFAGRAAPDIGGFVAALRRDQLRADTRKQDRFRLD